MMTQSPNSIYLHAQAKAAAYAAEAERARLLQQLATPSTLRRNVASFLHGLAERLAPDFDSPRPATSR